ncbi:MAG: hypothetical protein AAF657_41175, partial [Acidobacteriota bacterium]
MEAKGSFTGRARQRTTRRSVMIADRLAKIFISVGGIGTIIAVLGVMVFLVWVVVPLFLPAKVEDVDAFERASRDELLHLAVDEYQNLSWVLLDSGKAEVFRIDTGELRYQEQLFEEGQLKTASFLTRGDMVAFGLADGHVQLGEIGFDARILDVDDLPPQVLQALDKDPDTPANHENGVVERTPTGQYRWQQLKIELGDKTRVSTGPVHRVRHVVRSSGPLIVALAESHGLL